MRIDTNQIPTEGLSLREELSSSALDLNTDIVKFKGPVYLKAEITKITNALTVKLNLNAAMYLGCSRCLKEFKVDFTKGLTLNYPIERPGLVIELDQDIREEIILDYPLKPICDLNCKGLCPKCGNDLNEGKCGCKDR